MQTIEKICIALDCGVDDILEFYPGVPTMSCHNDREESVSCNLKEKLDVIEEDIAQYSRELLDILLKDRTTNENIIWATQ